MRDGGMTRKGWLLFAAMSVIWGIPYLLIKVAVREVSPASLVFLRTATGAVLLVPIALRNGQLRAVLPHWRALLLFTGVELAVPWLLLGTAEQRLSSSLSGLLVASVPLIGAVVGAVGRFDDRLDRRRLVGLLVGLGGVAVLLGFDIGRGDLGAVVEVGVVAVGYATGPIIISRMLADLPDLGVVAASLGICAVVYAPVGLWQLPDRLPKANVIASVVVLGVVCTATAFLVFFRLIAEVGPARSTVITYVNPAVAVALGVTLLGEHFTGATALGFVLIIAGCYLATRRQPSDKS